MKNIAMLAACLGVALSAMAGATDLSGTWRLDLARSDMGAGHGNPDFVITKVIDQRGDIVRQSERYEHALMFGRPVPDAKWDGEWTADGMVRDSRAAPMFPGLPAPASKTGVSWQGNNLVIVSRGVDPRRGAWFSERRYFLSDDASQLTEMVKMSAALGELEQRLVFSKAPVTAALQQ